MLRFLLVVMLAALAAPASARNGGSANFTVTQQRLVEAERRADSAERETQIREAADRLEDALTQQAYNRFEIWTGALVGLFSVLMALLVFAFSLRAERAAAMAAGPAAAAAARSEVAGAKFEIETLANDAKSANKAAEEAANEARKLLEEAQGEIGRLFEKVRAATASAEASAQQADEEAKKAKRGADAIEQATARNRVEPSETTRQPVTLTEDEAEAVKAGAEVAPEKPDAHRSVDEFKSQIGKASYIDEDHEVALRLASLMESYHSDDKKAVSFALRAQADALHALRRNERAIGVYSDLISRFADNDDSEIVEDVLWARHHKASLLNQISRHAEAERELKTLIPLHEQLFGAEGSPTIAARHELASAMLNQGRAGEAEADLSALVPTAERVFGPEHPNTLATRHLLAYAILDQGRSAEAETALRTVLSAAERIFGAEHDNTLTTRHTLARAILDQDRASEAEAEFRSVLSRTEYADGIEHSNTFVTRYCLAEAILATGNAEEAAQVLAPVPEAPNNPDWHERRAAALAFVRARVADALGKRDEASSWLNRAQAHYAAVYPPDHWDRQRLDAYLARRK